MQMTNFSRTLLLFVLLATFVLTGLVGGPENMFDVAANQWAAELRRAHPQLTSLAAILTYLGSIYVTLGLGLSACLILAVRRRPHPASLLGATIVVERLSVDGMKLVIARPRPNLELLPFMPGSYSFPSGHSANSMAIFTAVALFAVPPHWRRLALAAAICLSFVIGLTRIFLGVHWPSDVLGGGAWGLLITALALWAGRRSGAIEAEHDVVGGHLPPTVED
jgi:undecaprenyl-diphosphatase